MKERSKKGCLMTELWLTHKMENPRLIVIGMPEDNSYVGGKPAFEKVKEVVEKAKPVFVLSEKMENYTIENEHHFYLIMKKKKLSNMTSLEDVKELIKLCHRNKARLIGIDFENFLMTKEQQLAVKKHKDVSEEEEKEFEDLAKRRENKHVKMIRKYLKQTRRPLVVLVGAWHLRKGSQIRRDFKDLGDDARFVVPVNKEGKVVITPTREKLEWSK